MSSESVPAMPKAIGEDIEQLVIDAVDGLRPADDPEDWFDAVVQDAVGPRSTDALSFGSIAVLEAGTRVEIKACKRSVSNGARRDRAGCWTLQIDQHEQLLEDGAVYLLAVYEDASATKQLVDMLVVPASIIDEVLADRWYDVDRHEDEVAQLAWPHVIGREVDDA